MKRIAITVLSILLLLTITVGLFACKKDPIDPQESTSDLAARAVETVIPNGANNAKITADLLALLTNAGLEEAETHAVLLALAGEGNEKYEYALVDLSAGVFRTEHAASYRATLQAVADAVSPEQAGVIYYAATSIESDSLPYTADDCKKLASLLLSRESAFDANFLTSFLEEQTISLTEKEANTALLSLSASLRRAVGITEGARNYLYALAENKINELSASETELSEETSAALVPLREMLISLAVHLRDHYDLALTYAAEYLALSDAKLLLGYPYERQESTVYYGYRASDWSKTLISREDYLERRGGYDDYFEVQATLRGFTVNGTFLPLLDEDADLADRIYRLNLAYRAYNALSAASKSAFREAIIPFLGILAQNQGVLADLLQRPIIEDSGEPAASFDDLIAALPAIADFDPTDGISAEERDAATRTIAVYERYLHAYLPRLY